MIDLWQLPGPLALVGQIVDHLDRGNQVSVHDHPRFEGGLRGALARQLNQYQIALTSLYDDPARQPGEIIADEADGPRRHGGIFWAADIPAERAALWQGALRQIADRERDRPIEGRLRLVLALPVVPDEAACVGLKQVVPPHTLLSRADLEVMARYRLGARGEGSALARIIAELAVLLTEPMLGGHDWQSIADTLGAWQAMPVECAGDPGRLAAHARAHGLADPGPAGARLALWRAQIAVLMPEIDIRRLAIVVVAGAWCQIPDQQAAASNGAVADTRLLELRELVQLAGSAGLTRHDPVMNQLKALKTARDALAHLRPLAVPEIRRLVQLPVDTLGRVGLA